MSAPDPGERLRVGLCADCAHVRRLVSAKGSVFYRCGRAAEDATLREYPPLPVTRCRAYEEEAPGGGERPG